MLALSKLESNLDKGEGQGVDTLDPRFQDIASLIEQADYAAAAHKCQETFEELGGDIRLIGWFFFGLILQDGVAAIGPALQLACTIFRERFELVGPARKKDLHSTVGMSWLLSKLADRVEADDDDSQAEVQRLIGKATLDDAQGALEAVNELWSVFPEACPAPDPSKVTNQLRRLRGWLEGVVTALTPAAEPEPEPMPFEEDEEDEGDEGGEGGFEGGPVASGQGGGGAPMAGVQVEASPQLALLQARIAAFEILVQRGEAAKAAVIASDVMDAITNFDPRVYFPRLIGGFFAHYAHMADRVFGWQEKRGTMPWEIYRQLYQTNLEGYVRASEAELRRMLEAAQAPAPVHVAAPAPSYQAVAAPAPAWESPPPAPQAPAPAPVIAQEEDDDDEW